MKLRAYLLMTFVVAVWGSTFVLIKGALAGCPILPRPYRGRVGDHEPLDVPPDI